MALHSLISTQFPRDYLGLVGFSEVAREIKPRELPEVSWDFVYGTNMQHGFLLARQMLARQTGTKQIIMITDGEPTAHITASGDPFFHYPPVAETVDATLTEVMRGTREGIRINTFMLDATAVPAALHRAAHPDEPGPGLLHHARDPGRLRARRLHRAAPLAVARRPRPPRRLTGPVTAGRSSPGARLRAALAWAGRAAPRSR